MLRGSRQASLALLVTCLALVVALHGVGVAGIYVDGRTALDGGVTGDGGGPYGAAFALNVGSTPFLFVAQKDYSNVNCTLWKLDAREADKACGGRHVTVAAAAVALFRTTAAA
jgi:hypothetical protein